VQSSVGIGKFLADSLVRLRRVRAMDDDEVLVTSELSQELEAGGLSSGDHRVDGR